ncbi:26S proteasome non-ATPase regulatory subunit 1-like [Penaeus monodon]|uniref:26S proteasome non-ATPase regulatory subunit 1-like n=1 Tax=Penaeus monodon TaxID=6687 RepID=UPI0018A79A78|nr:26S proteasome non-ATPase regulatory subunit 1-like [Penaeus monodon]
MGFITSAAGILALLDENEDQLRVFALERLNEITDTFWPEIADSIQKIEKLEENGEFPKRELAALVVSKVYFHLGSYLDSLTYALRSGPMLHQDRNQLYIDTIKVHAIDHYIKLRAQKDAKMDARLEELLNNMFKRCITDQQYRHAIGIALETHRMDWFREAIMTSDDIVGSLTYSYKIAMQYIEQRKFRDEVLEELVSLYQGLETPDYVNMCQCLIHLDKPHEVASILDKLIKNDSLKSEAMDNELMAYQIGFDLYESATQDLLSHVRQGLRTTAPVPSLLKDVDAVTSTSTTSAAPAEGSTSGTNEDEEMATPQTEEENADTAMSEEKTLDDLTELEKTHQNRVANLARILSGEMTIEQHLQFLIANNHTDMLILRHTKEAVRASVCHTATVIANAFMHCGTTSDQFLRDNLEWLSRATNWAKMTATASLGVIHRGHEKEALTLMQAYLPKESNSPGYAESGSLYALGLIHANHGANIIEYLLNQTKDATSDIVRHGGCLGLGLAAMGTQRTDVYEQLKYSLFQDDAVTGEAAGLAMGLVMLGSANEQAVSDMVNYARDTQHEKILRGLAQGIALTMYGQQDQADRLITELSEDKDAILRRAAMYTVAMAYCGTASTPAMKRLLHVAVSDVDNDVRRAAVEALGFLLFRSPDQIPSMVSLLSESYNPHVRYGAAMALGVACSGTGQKESLGLLEPLTNDPVNFVRQGALIASALVLIQQTESTCPKVKDFRQLYAKVIGDKHEDSIAKFGAILAQGIIDAGGRNMTISLQSRTGHTSMTSVVGMFVFTQFWYWFPLAHFLSMAFTPTCLIGLNSELKMPKMQFLSNAKPSTYGYPAPLEEKKKEVAEKVTAVLSITAKAKKKDDERKKKEQKDEKMEVDEEKEKKEKEEKGEEREREKGERERERKREGDNFFCRVEITRWIKPLALFLRQKKMVFLKPNFSF